MAVHLVGDIHLPLHVGTAYLGQRSRYVVPATDTAIDGVDVFATHGDNALMVGSTPLHSYWDSRAVERAMKLAQVHEPGEFADLLLARHGAFMPDTDEPSAWPQRWADGTVRVSRQSHKGVVPGARRDVRDQDGKVHTEWPVTLPAGYALTAAAVAQERLRLAGMRLGVLMQTIWPALPLLPNAP